MSVRIEKENDGERWNRMLARSPQASPFHWYGFLERCAAYADATLHPYVGYRGEEPIGLFPLFETKKGPFRMAFSPPPELKAYYLGPAMLNAENLKVRKREKRNLRFVQGVLERVDREIEPRYVNVITTPTYDDERPFHWSDFGAKPQYTYTLDLTPEEDELLASFSRSARRAVREDVDGFEISEADPGDIERILDSVETLHEEKGSAFNVPPGFVPELYRTLPDDMIHAHVGRRDGEFRVGQISLEYDGTLYAWLGGSADADSIPAYEKLDWHLIRLAKSRDCAAYDLIGADIPGVCEYKAKFGPDLCRHQTLTRSSWDTKAAAALYKLLR